MSSRTTLSLVIAALALATLALACAGPQPVPLAPTPIPTLIPATLPPEPTQAPLPTSTGPAGATIFATNCSPCHNLTTERKVGPGLQGLFSLPALPNGEPVNDDNVKAWIRSGSPRGMPSFGPDKISDSDLDILVAYLKEATGAAPATTSAPQPSLTAPATTAPTTTVPAATAPAAVSADVFNKNCSACHNLTTERNVGPGLQGLFSFPALPNGQPVTDANLRGWIRNGGGAMPPIALSNADLEAVIAYLKQATQ